MAKNIQIRNVPERLHRELKRRAKKRGQSLTAYIEQLLEQEVRRPPIGEVLDEIERLEPVRLDRPVAEYIREERELREKHLESLLRTHPR
jgi:plasmid stability protein